MYLLKSINPPCLIIYSYIHYTSRDKTLFASDKFLLVHLSDIRTNHKSRKTHELFFFLITPLVVVAAAAEVASLAPCAISCPMGPWGSCRRRSLHGPSCSRSPGAEGRSVNGEKERTDTCIRFIILSYCIIPFLIFTCSIRT